MPVYPRDAQRFRPDPGERGEHGPVGPGHVRPGVSPQQQAAFWHPTASSVFQFFCYDGDMARRKTTVYIDEELLTAAKVAAARSHKHEYEVFEDALRRHLGLQEVVERVCSSLGTDAPSEEESLRLAREELAAVRAAARDRQAS